jgi:hypothetical protein
MIGAFVHCGAFRLRITGGWSVLESGGDDRITLKLSSESQSGILLEVTAIRASEGKVFVDEQGRRPWETPELLLRLSVRYGERECWSPPIDKEVYQKKLTWGGASFRDGPTFYRVWHVAGDGAIAVGVCESLWGERTTAVAASLPVIQSLRWKRL